MQVTGTVAPVEVAFLDAQAKVLGWTRAEVVALAVRQFTASGAASALDFLDPRDLERLTAVAARVRMSCADLAAVIVGVWLGELAGQCAAEGAGVE